MFVLPAVRVLIQLQLGSCALNTTLLYERLLLPLNLLPLSFVFASPLFRVALHLFLVLPAFALHPLLFGWFGGFYGAEGTNEHPVRWCSSDGELHIFNQADRTRVVRLVMSFRLANPEPAEVRLDGPLFSARVAIDGRSQPYTREVTIPPGKHVIHFRCDARRLNAPQDGRTLVFRVEDFQALTPSGG